MSLAEQREHWYPTSVQVTVVEARNLRLKGKNGTNDAYAIMQVAKDKFSTSVAEKSVAPVWKEEATFDLPLFHRENADRCTLHIIIMHRALVGLDKLLGQAIINLVDLQDNKARTKTDWYKLVDKNGKADKERGEVLLDIQFMRNNMTASMFDLSMQDKPRSRISKLKDKVRGKKKEGLSDSASAIVPSTGSQILTDSEGEGEANEHSSKSKKSSKLKSLFAPKSNLHRGVSQSMSTLGTLPEKNSSLSGSRSSGLNVESPDVKKKFKFLGHKRNSSTDSKVSLGPFSLLSRSKQNIQDQNNLCINGSHVYAEEQESKQSFGSTLSLNNSAKSSVEDLRKLHERNASDVSADSFKGLSIPTYKPEPVEKALHVPQHPQEDTDKKNKKIEGRLQELLEKQEEQEKKRQQEREEQRRKQEEDERKIKLEEEERRRQEDEERKRKRHEEETKKAEEQRRQEESRVAERLTSLFGLGKKKEELSPPAQDSPKHMEAPASTNPFEEIPLSPDSMNPFLNESPAEPQKEVRSTFTPTPPSNAFPGRTAKVSAVKPRPHPVKPLSSTESQSPSSISVGKDLKISAIREVAEKSKNVESGPYTQLTQEELITLVVKQQVELSKKDTKIVELEDYIDNLLVRVIEEKPSILLAMNSKAY
ncbi:rab11 family-interacting protein 1 isoform X2 [Hoplias malabaricus]|uniref:rab11 family-interacting protein 1 isoform X2 n=1 Tax=Hoplias malabaricus TaxID=27720 RepID=UPI00346208B2